MPGRAVDEYRAPLFLAWQLTNRCSARCIACCEESGPDRAWRDELGRDEALDLARRILESGIPYVAFGGGEPLGAPHCWELFERLAAGGGALQIETHRSRIDGRAPERPAGAGGGCGENPGGGAPPGAPRRGRPGGGLRAGPGPDRGR